METKRAHVQTYLTLEMESHYKGGPVFVCERKPPAKSTSGRENETRAPDRPRVYLRNRVLSAMPRRAPGNPAIDHVVKRSTHCLFIRRFTTIRTGGLGGCSPGISWPIPPAVQKTTSRYTHFVTWSLVGLPDVHPPTLPSPTQRPPFPIGKGRERGGREGGGVKQGNQRQRGGRRSGSPPPLVWGGGNFPR